MPLFRRQPAGPEAQSFTVGVDGHRVAVGVRDGGCSHLLADIEGYVGAIANRAPTRPDGRDSVAVQNAKMDYAEMTDAAMLVVTLALEELEEQGIVRSDEVPRRPSMPALDSSLPIYEYIQLTYERARRRVAWIHEVDALFRQRGIAITKPAPIS
jgi:hypothetical protein